MAKLLLDCIYMQINEITTVRMNKKNDGCYLLIEPKRC